MRAGRVAIAVVIGAAAAIAGAEPLVPALRGLLGVAAEPALVFEVTIPAGTPSEELARIEPTWRARLAPRAIEVELRASEPAWLLEVAVRRAGRERRDGVAAALTRQGRLELRAVLEDTPWARQVAAALRWEGGDVTAEEDTWSHADSGAWFRDVYLRGPDAGAIEAAVDALGIPLPDGAALGFERVVPHDGGPAYARSYVLDAAVLLDHRDVAAARVSRDAYTHQPEVMVELTARGRAAFADATRRLLGRKLAIVADGWILAAPVIQAEISGGQIAITMGSGPFEALQADADALAAALAGAGDPLPPGLAARFVEAVEPSAAAIAALWALRAAFGALCGLAAWLLAGVLARPAWTAPAPRDAPGEGRAWGALARAALVTAGAVAVLILAERVRLPWLARDLDAFVSGDVTVWPGAGAGVSVVALGFAPVITGFVLVELVALAIPRWRRARTGTAAQRRALDVAGLAVALAVAALQAALLTAYLQAIPVGEGAVLAPGALPRVAAIATLVGGVALQVVAAALISRRGLCDGWVVLIGVELARHLHRAMTPPFPYEATLGWIALHAAIAAAAAAAAVALAHRRGPGPGGRRMPPGGIAPVLLVPSLLALLALPYLFDAVGPATYERLAARPPWAELVVVAGLAAVIAWRAHPRHDRAIAIAVGFSVGLAALPLLQPAWARDALLAAAAALVAVAAVEVARGARHVVTRPGWRPLVAVRDADLADRIVDALAAAGIPAAASGAPARALLGVFGPFVAVTIAVPAGRLADAAAVADRALR